MEQIITKKEFDKFMGFKEKVRGAGMKMYANFIFKEKGAKGLKKLEDLITSLGYPVKYKKIKAMSFYPLGLEIATLVGIKRLFNFGNEKFEEMGKFQIKGNFIFTLFLNRIVSLKKMAKGVNKVWQKAVGLGNLNVVEVNEGKKYVIFRIENFDYHPLFCHIFKGTAANGFQMIIGKETICQERKCTFSGDDYHEYLLKW